MSIKSLVSIFVLAAISLSATMYSKDADAGIYCDAKAKMEGLTDVLRDFCNNEDLVDNSVPDPEAEEGEPGWTSWFFEIPEDQKCDLGLEFPDLSFDLDFGLERLNVCNVLKTVTENAVEQVNEEFEAIENEIEDAEDAVNDYGEIDLDELAEEVENDFNDFLDEQHDRSNGNGGS